MRFLRWVPAGLLASVQAAAWVALFSGGMGGVVGWLFLLAVIPFVGIIAFIGAGFAAVLKRRFGSPLSATLLLSVLAMGTGLWNFGLGKFAYPASIEKTVPSATVRLPSDSQLRVVWGGDRLATNQHAFFPDQRWAYDLVIAPYFGGSSTLTDYGCWGSPVVAPIGAKVHAAHDGEPDAEPGKHSNNVQKPLGNFVALELGDGESKSFLIIAHLQLGSLMVKAGDLLHEGFVIGRCGNSGNTSEPHIHIHHQRQDPLKFPVNFAEGLPLFFRDHDGSPMPVGGVDEVGGARGDLVMHVANRHL